MKALICSLLILVSSGKVTLQVVPSSGEKIAQFLKGEIKSEAIAVRVVGPFSTAIGKVEGEVYMLVVGRDHRLKSGLVPITAGEFLSFPQGEFLLVFTREKEKLKEVGPGNEVTIECVKEKGH